MSPVRFNGAISSVANRPASVTTDEIVSQSKSASETLSSFSPIPATAFSENRMSATGERYDMCASYRPRFAAARRYGQFRNRRIVAQRAQRENRAVKASGDATGFAEPQEHRIGRDV